MTSSMNPKANSSAIIPFTLFVFATLASCGYCVYTDQFNGDFWPLEITLSRGWLFLAALLSIMPYLIGWYLNKLTVQHSHNEKRLIVPCWFLESLLLSVFIWDIAITIAFGVGVMSQEVYSAPYWIKPLIQISNRIDPFFIGVFYILSSPKKKSKDVKAALLMITLGLLRAGLGSFVYILIALSIKYREEWFLFFKRRLPILIVLACLAPYAVGKLYSVRSSLRSESQEVLTISDLIVAKLAGRLSSYSNFTYIVQQSTEFATSAQKMSPFYYPLQIAGSIVSGELIPSVTPEKMLIDVNLLYDGYSTFMAGVPGNFLIGWFVAPWVAVFNFVLMISMMVGTLNVSQRFGNGNASSVGIGMLLYPLTSGVSYEFAVLLCNVVLIYILSRIIIWARPSLRIFVPRRSIDPQVS